MTRPATLAYESDIAAELTANVASGSIGRSVTQSVATLAIAVWLGSLVHLLLSVSTLFTTFPKAMSQVAVQAAPAIFHASERFSLIVAAIALATTIALHWQSPSKARRWIVWLLAAGAMLALVQATVISPKMDALREAGQSGLDAFKTLHGMSSSQYLAQTLLVFVATTLLPTASTRK